MRATVAADVSFDLCLLHGRCVGVHIPEGLPAALALARELLLPEECAFAAGLAPLRCPTWVGGRIALREALRRSGLEAPAILPDARGAPRLPPGVAGSISHKARFAVALTARSTGSRGVDVELDRALTSDISSRVLTEEEAAEMASLPAGERGRAVLLRFSMKEAVYKALDPYVRRYVAFREVTVTPRPDGTAGVQTALAGREGPFRVEAAWLRVDGWVVTTAAVVDLAG